MLGSNSEWVIRTLRSRSPRGTRTPLTFDDSIPGGRERQLARGRPVAILYVEPAMRVDRQSIRTGQDNGIDGPICRIQRGELD